MQYREVIPSDIDSLADIRALEWGTKDYWIRRINGYLDNTISPGDALPPRVIFVAQDKQKIPGFIAGHLTTRLGCEGELEWINVLPVYRGQGIAHGLLCRLAEWFAANNAFNICVDPDNTARAFYSKYGAIYLNKHWMGWQDIRTVLENKK